MAGSRYYGGMAPIINFVWFANTDDIRNDVTINKTRALVWGRKRLQLVVLKDSVLRSGLDMEPLKNNSEKE